MLKILDYLYYHLYAFYYKDGNFKPTDNPSLRASGILSFTFWLWIFFAILLYYRYSLNERTLPNKWLLGIVYLILFIPIDYFYRSKKRDEYVYEIYKSESIKNKKVGFVIVLGLAIVPLLINFLITFL